MIISIQFSLQDSTSVFRFWIGLMFASYTLLNAGLTLNRVEAIIPNNTKVNIDRSNNLAFM